MKESSSSSKVPTAMGAAAEAGTEALSALGRRSLFLHLLYPWMLACCKSATATSKQPSSAQKLLKLNRQWI
jgi:hypothetical protein